MASTQDVAELHKLLGGDDVLSVDDVVTLYAKIGGNANEAAGKIYDQITAHDVENASDLLQLLLAKDQRQEDEQLVKITRAWGLQEKNEAAEGDWVSVEPKKTKNRVLSGDTVHTDTSSLRQKSREPSGELRVVRVPPFQTFDVAKENLKLYQRDAVVKKLLTEVYSGEHTKLLVILRGVPGSGKSTLGNVIYSLTRTGAICSADSFFTRPDGRYVFDKNRLSEAHQSAVGTCETALSQGLAVVIVDNTNTTRQEVDVYVRLGVKYNYAIQLVEPPTDWKTDARLLSKKNIHGVPKEAITRMLQRFERLSVDHLIKDILKKDPSRRYSPPELSSAVGKRGAEICTTLLVDNKDDFCLSNVPSKPLVNLTDYIAKATSSPAGAARTKGTSTYTSTGGKQELSSWAGSPRMGAVFPCARSHSHQSESVGCLGDVGKVLSVELCGTESSGRRTASPRSSWCELPKVDLVSDPEFPQLTTMAATKTGFSHEELFLLNSFPDCGQEELLHFFELCQNDLNDTISLLLDSGYEMSDDPSQIRPSLVDTGDVRGLGGMKGDFVDVDQNRRRSPKSRHGSSSTDLNHNERPSSAASLRGSQQIRTDSPKTRAKRLKNKKSEISDEETIVVDGPDWVDLKIPDEFMATLYSKYGEIDGYTSSQLKPRDKVIRIPPKLAFDLYGYVYLNVHRRLQEEEEAEDEENFDWGGDDELFPDEFEKFENAPMAQWDNYQLEDVLRRYKELELEKCHVDRSVNLDMDEVMAIETSNGQIEEEKTRLRESIPRTLNFRIRLNDLKKSFPNLSNEVLDDALVSSDFNYEEALQKMKSLAPHKFVEVSEPPSPIHKISCKTMEELELASEEYDPDKVAAMTQEQIEKISKGAKYWEDQTELLSAEMDVYREKAKTHRDKMGARDYYSDKANMLRPHVNAAQRKYAYLHLLRLNGGVDCNQIDLHGQPVKHGVRFALKFLQSRQRWVNEHLSRGKQLDVRIITGWGKHSRNNISRLRLQVMGTLSTQHYSYYTSPGEIRVHLRPQT